MKLIDKTKDEIGRDVLTVEKRFLFWSWQVKYLAASESPPNYWDWVRLPNKTLVTDLLQFQLDRWNREPK
jgi:hypothetical protein